MPITEIEKQENGTEPETQERTFTQSELDEIVQSRLAKERAKFADYTEVKEKASKFDEMEEANETELQKANERAEALQKQLDQMNAENDLRQIRTKVANEKGIPVELLTADTEEACTAQADGILAFAKKDAYPNVKDGGEVVVTSNKTNGEIFGDWLKTQLS